MKPFPFQLETVKQIESSYNGRCLVALDMGLGKTLISLGFLRRNKNSFPAIIICPASVKYHWEREALEVLKIRPSILEGETPSPADDLFKRNKIVVINYDILHHWLPTLKKLKAQTVIIDESQKIANPKTKRTKAIKILCNGTPYILALSGTPLLNRPIELFPTLNILRPDSFNSRFSFAMKYCNPKRTPWGWDFNGASNLASLRGVLCKTCMIRKRKSEVMQELPDKIRKVIPISLSSYEEYRKAQEDFSNWLRRQDAAKAEKAGQAEALVKMGYLLRLVARLKLPYTVKWINEFLQDTDEKLVVFAVHRKMIAALERRCKSKSVVIDGSVIGRKRSYRVDQFQRDKSTRLLIGNIKAAGIGITLTAASVSAFAELSWVPGEHTQAEDRLHRISQKDTVWANYLIARNTIEEKLCRVIQRKQEIVSTTLDGSRVIGDLDVFNILMKELKK